MCASTSGHGDRRWAKLYTDRQLKTDRPYRPVYRRQKIAIESKQCCCIKTFVHTTMYRHRFLVRLSSSSTNSGRKHMCVNLWIHKKRIQDVVEWERTDHKHRTMFETTEVQNRTETRHKTKERSNVLRRNCEAEINARRSLVGVLYWRMGMRTKTDDAALLTVCFVFFFQQTTSEWTNERMYYR